MNEKEIIVITDSPKNDIYDLKECLNEIIEQIYSNKVVLKDGTILKFHSNKNMVGIHNYYYFREIFEHFLKVKNKQLQQENKKLNDAIQTYDILLKSNVEDNKRLTQKIKKALEKIEEYNLGKYDYSIPSIGVIELKEILEGKSK